MTPDKKGFWAKVWYENEPIASHSISVLTIILALLVIACVLELIEKVLPGEKAILEKIKTADVLFAFGLICFFIGNTSILLLVRGAKNIIKEIKE